MKIDVALREVHEAEAALNEALLRTGERHADDHDVFHLTRTLASWCDEHLRALAAHERRYGVEVVAASGEAERGGDAADLSVLLLRDMRDLHLAAVRASVAWTVLGQGAQAVRDGELLATVTASHPETIRTMKWTLQKLKEASPQILAS